MTRLVPIGVAAHGFLVAYGPAAPSFEALGNTPRGMAVEPVDDGLEDPVGTIELTEATFEETVTGDGIVLVDWWAS
jgi:hypothetical protein